MSNNFDDIFNLDDFDDFTSNSKSVKLNEGDRRMVSILFADIKGYTALSSLLDHEHVKIILDKLLKAFSVCITKYGGYIDKYEGDLVMGLFGAKKASEEDTKRSILAAFEILKATKQYNKVLEKHPKFSKYNIDFSVRIGVNTGYVTTGKVGQEREGDFTVYGESVNMASRMETNAPINSVLINEETKAIIEHEFSFTSLGLIEVKGYDKKIAVYTVNGFIEVKDNFWDRSSSKFIGRKNELEQLTNKLLIKDSIKQMLFISGEAGIGKSRLIYEFLMNTFGRGDILTRNLPSNLTLKGYASSIVEQPYYIFKNMLKRYFYYASNSKNIDGLNFEYIKYILEDKKSEELEELNDKEFQLNLLINIQLFIDYVASVVKKYGYPLIFIVEDIQSIDESSKMVFDYLLSKFTENNSDNSIIFIFTSRNREIPFDNLTTIDFEKINLEKFDENEILNLIKELDIKNEILDDYKDKIIDNSGGNPLFIEEWINSIKSKEDDSLFVPDNLNSLILSNIDKLPPYERILIQKASVIGKEFSKLFLSSVVDKLEVEYNFEDIFSSLVKKEYFVKISRSNTKDSYIFRQSIVGEVAYNTLLLQNREMLHLIIADIIEEKNINDIKSVSYDLVHHYGLSNNRGKELKYLFIAGKLAFKNFQNKKAIKYFKRIKENNENMLIDREYIYSMLSYSDVYIRLGDFEAAKKELIDIINLAKINKLDQELAISKRCLGEVFIKSGEALDSVSVLNDSLKIAKKLENEFLIARIKGVIGEANFWLGHYEIAKKMYEFEYEIDTKAQNKKGIIKVLGNLGLVYYKLGDYEKSKDILLKQIDLAIEFDDKSLIAESSNRLGVIYLALHKYDNAIEVTTRAKEICIKTGDVVLLAKVLGNIGLIYKNKNKYEEALIMYKKQEDIAKNIKDLLMLSIVSINIGNIYIASKEYEKALEFFYKSNILMTERNYKNGESISLGNIAICYMNLGYTMKAIKNFDKKLNIAIEIDDKLEESVARLGFAECYLEIGEYEIGITECKKAIDISVALSNDNNVEKFKVLSELFYKKGDKKQAEKYVIKAIVSDIDKIFIDELKELKKKITE